MTVKLVLLKSGEDIISDVKEMIIEEKVVGYFLEKPCTIRMKNPADIAENEDRSFQVALFPWIPISKESTIPIPSDWVVTIVEPVDKLTDMYKKQVLKNDKDTSTDEQSDTDQQD
jgi:hypothetical protein